MVIFWFQILQGLFTYFGHLNSYTKKDSLDLRHCMYHKYLVELKEIVATIPPAKVVEIQISLSSTQNLQASHVRLLYVRVNRTQFILPMHFFSTKYFVKVDTYYTMLQKLSKCEVKGWLCWNLIILPPLWFWVKSSCGEFKHSKNAIFGNFRPSEFWY